MRIEKMTDGEIVKAYAEEFARKADEAYMAYQGSGLARYDNAYHKYSALSDALTRDINASDYQAATAAIKSELMLLATRARQALRTDDAPEGALAGFAREAMAVARIYGAFDGGVDDGV